LAVTFPLHVVCGWIGNSALVAQVCAWVVCTWIGAAVPVIDLNGLGRLAEGPFFGGVQAPFYTPDGFHPGTVGQGLLADTILEALAAFGFTRL
jgi:hypothetical protein